MSELRSLFTWRWRYIIGCHTESSQYGSLST